MQLDFPIFGLWREGGKPQEVWKCSYLRLVSSLCVSEVCYFCKMIFWNACALTGWNILQTVEYKKHLYVADVAATPCQSNTWRPRSKLRKTLPEQKLMWQASKSPVGNIFLVTLIRTDTTLDHSQKAEKVWDERVKGWERAVPFPQFSTWSHEKGVLSKVCVVFGM